MRTIPRLIYLSVLFLFLSTLTYATDHYVDANASGQNNGTNWNDAWESFSSINWGSVNPGDVVYVSGGTDSTVYGNLSIGASGTEGNPITIRNSYETGHNGRVIIDYRGNSSQNCIHTNSNDNLYIKGIETHGGARGIFIYTSSVNVTIDSCIIKDFVSQGGIRIGGDDCYPCASMAQNTVIKNCIIWSVAGTNSGQTDVIYAMGAHHTTLDNNFIWQRDKGTSSGSSHSDAVQAYLTGGWLIKNNVVVSDSNGNGMAFILGAESYDADGVDSVIVYNNLIVHRGIWFSNPNLVGNFNTRWYSRNSMPPVYFIHNTTVSYGPDAEGWRIYYPFTVCANNINAQYSLNGSYTGNQTIRIDWNQSINPAFTYQNLYYRDWSSSVSFTGGWNPSFNGFSGFQSAGGGGFIDDPEFTHNWYGIPAYQYTGMVGVNSPARNQGDNLQSLVESLGLQWTDRFGTPRDNTPTLGSFEYTDGPDLTAPTVVGAGLQDSVTLVVNFSESLDATTAEDENNYSISNNIDVFNASLSGSQVTLQTSTHSFGSYVVTVVNVEDLAGNPIAQNNTANYERIFIPPDSTIMFTVQNVEGVVQEPNHTPIKTIDGLGALDGDPDSRWAAQPMPEELIFDLGAIRMVSKTRLSFYNWNSGRVYNYSISVSNDHSNWNTIVPQSTSASNEEWTIDEFSLVSARYVRVNFINNNQSDWAGLWEGEIWGPDLPASVETTLPEEFLLYQNYPNPFNPSTKIKFSISKESNVNLSIYNLIGELVTTLVDEQMTPGIYEYEFNAGKFSSGIYLYKIIAGDFVETKKMILMK